MPQGRSALAGNRFPRNRTVAVGSPRAVTRQNRSAAEAWGQLSRPRRPTVVWGLWRRFSHRHARTASACGSCSLGSRPGDRRGPERPLRPCGPPRPQRRLHLEAAARGRRGGHPGSWQLRAARSPPRPRSRMCRRRQCAFRGLFSKRASFLLA